MNPSKKLEIDEKKKERSIPTDYSLFVGVSERILNEGGLALVDLPVLAGKVGRTVGMKIFPARPLPGQAEDMESVKKTAMMLAYLEVLGEMGAGKWAA